MAETSVLLSTVKAQGNNQINLTCSATQGTVVSTDSDAVKSRQGVSLQPDEVIEQIGQINHLNEKQWNAFHIIADFFYKEICYKIERLICTTYYVDDRPRRNW